MTNDNNIQNELRDLAPVVANLSKNNPYEIPVGYFNSLAENITAVIADKKIELPKADRQSYTVPADYFETLSQTILLKIRHTELKEELNEVAPLLNSISNKLPYSAPEGYFAEVAFRAPQEEKTAKIISLRKVSKWVTYAAAASVLFILSSSSYMFINHHLKGVDKSPTIEQRLAQLDDNELINYLNNDIETVDQNTYNQASDTDAEEINHLLINASDEELQNFLDAENDPGENTIKGI